MKRKIRKFLIKTERLCEKLNRSQKFYFFGVIFSVLAVFLWISPFNSVFFSIVGGAITLLTFAVISDILIVYKKIWETNIGKGLILVLYAAATNLAYAISSQFVNVIIQYESAKLVYATNFVAVMLIPIFILISTGIVFFILFLFGQFYVLTAVHADQKKLSRCLIGVVPSNRENYPVFTLILRFLVVSSMLGFYWGLAGNAFSPYVKFMESTTKSFIYNFEAKSYSRCVLQKGWRVIPVNENELIVVKKSNGNYSFEAQLCEPKLKSNRPQ